MGERAAFFDLDRTLLATSTTHAFTQALAEAGVIPARSLPGAGLLGAAYDHFGESVGVMALARAAALAARGWPVAPVAAAAEVAAERISGQLAPYAAGLLAELRRGDVRLVLATTSPEHLVRPLAERLGFDDVVATRYATRQGVFTGQLAGPFVWAFAKAAAVRDWARAHDVELSDSWAYSDSIYDLPLLDAVGHPVAVNPDLRLRAVAVARRWPRLWLDVPPGVPKLAGLEPFDLVRLLARPELFPYARFELSGLAHLPGHGPAIVAINHRSYFDIAAVGVAVARVGRAVRFLGKKEVFDAPVIGQLARALGGIRVERGSGSLAPLAEAERALAAGELVAIMPQGTIPRGPAFFDPVLSGRPGVARLAAATGAPVVPVGLWGTEAVWPRSARMPNVFNLAHPPTVQVRVGVPFHPGATTASGAGPTRRRAGQAAPPPGAGPSPAALQAATEQVMAEIVALLPAEATRRREPTAEELARTYPPGGADRD